MKIMHQLLRLLVVSPEAMVLGSPGSEDFKALVYRFSLQEFLAKSFKIFPTECAHFSLQCTMYNKL